MAEERETQDRALAEGQCGARLFRCVFGVVLVLTPNNLSSPVALLFF